MDKKAVSGTTEGFESIIRIVLIVAVTIVLCYVVFTMVNKIFAK